MKEIIITLLLCALSVQAQQKKEIIGSIISTDSNPILIYTTEAQATSNWPVTEDIIKNIQPILMKYIEQNDINIYTDITKYRCQYVGIVINGHHQIFCSFFLYEERYKDWKNRDYPIAETVDDGGRGYFRFVYDVEDGKCKGFRTNGYG